MTYGRNWISSEKTVVGNDLPANNYLVRHTHTGLINSVMIQSCTLIHHHHGREGRRVVAPPCPRSTARLHRTPVGRVESFRSWSSHTVCNISILRVCDYCWFLPASSLLQTAVFAGHHHEACSLQCIMYSLSMEHRLVTDTGLSLVPHQHRTASEKLRYLAIQNL